MQCITQSCLITCCIQASFSWCSPYGVRCTSINKIFCYPFLYLFRWIHLNIATCANCILLTCCTCTCRYIESHCNKTAVPTHVKVSNAQTGVMLQVDWITINFVSKSFVKVMYIVLCKYMNSTCLYSKMTGLPWQYTYIQISCLLLKSRFSWQPEGMPNIATSNIYADWIPNIVQSLIYNRLNNLH